MRERASFFVAASVVVVLSSASRAARADEVVPPYGPPPAVEADAPPKAKALVQLHLSTPAGAQPAQLYERAGIRDTLVCSSPCHPTVAHDAELIVRFGEGAASKRIDLSRGPELDVIVKPESDDKTFGWLAVVGAVGATAGSIYLFATSKNGRGELDDVFGHLLGHIGGGVALLAVGAGLTYVGVELLRNPGPIRPRVIVKPVAR